MAAFNSPTLASLSKLRPAPPPQVETQVTSQVTELRRAVKRLRRDASQTYELEYETQKTFEFLSSQVEVLRGAVATIAGAVEEEFSAVRAESAESFGEIGSHLAHHASGLKSVRAAVAAVDESNGDALSGLAAKIRDVAGAAGAVEARLNSVEATLGDNAADVAQDLHTLRSMIRDNTTAVEMAQLRVKEEAEIASSLRGELKTLAANQEALHGLVSANAASVSGLEATVSALASQVSGIQTTLAGVAEVAARAESMAKKNASGLAAASRSSAAASSLPLVASFAGGSDSVSGPLAGLQSEVSQLREMVQATRDEAATASSALAQDVHTLADETSSIKVGFHSAMETMYDRLRSYVMTVEEKTGAQVSHNKAAIAELTTKVDVAGAKSARELRRAMDALKDAQAGFQSAVRTDVDALKAESRKLRSSVRVVESAVDSVTESSARTCAALAGVSEAVEHVEAETKAIKSHGSFLETQILSHRTEVQKQMDSTKRDTLLRVDGLRSSLRSSLRSRGSALDDDALLTLRPPSSGDDFLDAL